MNYRRAFTLIETITVVAILAIVGAALSSTILYFYRTNSYVIQEGTAVQGARNGLSTAMKNLREASYGDDGSYPIQSVSTSSVTFYADVNGDGRVDKIRYYLQNSTLYRGTTSSTGTPPSYASQPESTYTLAAHVVNGTSSPIFQYTDNTGAVLPAPVDTSAISSIITTLMIDVDPNRSPTVYTLLGSATLRNLRS